MSCKKCGEPAIKCGCESTSIPLPPPCAQGTPDCPDPDPCSETFSAKCVIYQGNDLNCIGIHEDDTIESAIQTIGTTVSTLTCPTCTYIIDLVTVVVIPPVVTIDINGTIYSLGAYGNVANWDQILINLNSLNLGTWSYTVVGNIITLIVTGSETYNTLTVLQTPNVVVTATCVDPLAPIVTCEECFFSSSVTMTTADMRVAIAEIGGYAGKVFPITIPTGQAIEIVSASIKYTFVGVAYTTPSDPSILFTHDLASGVTGPQVINEFGVVDSNTSVFVRATPYTKASHQVVINEPIWLAFEAATGPGGALGFVSAYIMYRFITP